MTIRHVSLYNGQVNIEFDPDKHYYHVVGSNAKPDGVTTILGLIPKYLLPWVARTTADYMRDGILQRLEGEGSIEPTFLATLHEEAKKEHTRKKEAAGDVGTLVHAFAEEIITQGSVILDVVPPKALPGVGAFLDWWKTVDIDRSTIESERIVFSRRLFYCGTCDLFATINGKPTVVDFKTGSGFYEDQPLQLAAYAMAIEEELGIGIKDGWIIHLDKETGKCTPYHVEIDHELKADWEQVRIAWRAVKRNQARHKQIKENQKCQRLTNTIPAAAQA
jgi:CRISPR/Cas system-associated exonuclease Cas4 (RecB family)